MRSSYPSLKAAAQSGRACDGGRGETMIVNNTTYDAEDMEFIYSRWERRPKPKPREIASLVIDLIAICWALYMPLRYWERGLQNMPLKIWLIVIITVILAGRSIYQFATRNRSRTKRAMEKVQKKREDRVFTFGEDSVEVLNRTEGVEYRSDYSYDNLHRLYVRADRLYAVMRLQKNDVYMPVHDSGYTEGSKEELIALLDSHNVRREEL